MPDQKLEKTIESLANVTTNLIANLSKEMAEEHKKTEKALASLIEENKKTAAAQQKTEAAQQKTEAALLDLKKTVKKTNQQLGGITNIQGEIAEDLFHRNFQHLMQKRGITLDIIEYKLKAPGAGGREYDLTGINGELVVLAEIKNKLGQKDVERLVKEQIPYFRRDFSTYSGHGLIGAVGGLVVKKEVQKLAESLGLYVFTQQGEDGAQIANSTVFKAKVY